MSFNVTKAFVSATSAFAVSMTTLCFLAVTVMYAATQIL